MSCTACARHDALHAALVCLFRIRQHFFWGAVRRNYADFKGHSEFCEYFYGGLDGVPIRIRSHDQSNSRAVILRVLYVMVLRSFLAHLCSSSCSHAHLQTLIFRLAGEAIVPPGINHEIRGQCGLPTYFRGVSTSTNVHMPHLAAWTVVFAV